MIFNTKKIKNYLFKTGLCVLFFLCLFGLYSAKTIFAASIEDLKSKIDSTNDSYAQIQKEIANLESQLKTLGDQKNSLSNEIKIIDTTTKKLQADILLNENRISNTNLEIQSLGLDIGNKQTKINSNLLILAETIKQLNAGDKSNFLISLLEYNSISDAMSGLESLASFQDQIKRQTDEIKSVKADLEDKKTQTEQKQKELLTLKSSLDDRKKILAANRSEKDQLLSLTKNKATNYEKDLAAQKSKAEALAQELAKYESELRLAFDPKSIPPAGKGVLVWPLDSIRITQTFGVTVDSVRLYKSGTHNGVDFAASVGTRVMSAGNGVVEGIGDTDIVCKGASFGKWVFIRYDNGLASTYGHFSLITARPGQRVKTGDVVGYSGNTGYTTGPHLHMSVYAGQGVKISTIKSTVCRGTYTVPLADPKAYLDPLIYL
jgi:murein DD-endopeptidase MepM/ murein hydrolase activator NlpD